MALATDNPTSNIEQDNVLWLRKLPKAEIHLHLEGTVTPQTLVTLSQQCDEKPLTIDEATALYDYTDFLHFLRTFKVVGDRLQSPEAYGLITREMIKDLAAQGVVHADVFVAWTNAMEFRPHLEFDRAMAAMEAARLEGEKQYGVTILWIIDASRHWGPEKCGLVFDKAIQWKDVYPSIVGIGIGGDEVRGPCIWFKDAYAKAKAAGMRLTAHAGESTGPVEGPKSIRDALAIGAERIGHGTCAVYDQELMQILREKQTPIEVSVTSNLRTCVCPSLEQHPIKQFIKGGLMVTINSDDPAMFGSNLLEEYVLIQKELGLSREDMRVFAKNGVNASFLSARQKANILAKIDAY